MKVEQVTIRSKIQRDPLDRSEIGIFTLLLCWDLHFGLALTKLLTRHTQKNFADSAKFTVLIDLFARDPYFLPTSSGSRSLA